MAEGRYPESRHDDRAWLPSDDVRTAISGKPLPWRAAVVFLKGDWAEFSHSLGLPTWSSNSHPCM
eukprot:3484878-Alexandrium_andersonii.AAC.1